MQRTPSTWTTQSISLKLAKPPIKAVVMVATYRAAARFIEKTRDLIPADLLQRFVRRLHRACRRTEAVGTALHQRRDRDAGGAGGVGLFIRRARYKNALAKYFPGEAADYVSFEGYVAANVLITGH